MYNNFISEKKRKIEIRNKDSQSQEEITKKKYEMKIQPALLDQYQKRINSFIQQLETKTSKIQIRQKRAITLKNFTFSKTGQNFHSQTKNNFIPKSNSKKNLSPELQISKTVNTSKHQFRQRRKSKQLDGYMKFGLSQLLKPQQSKTPKPNQLSKGLSNFHKLKCSESQRAAQITESVRNTSRDTIRQTHRSQKSAFFNLTIKTSDYFREEILDNIEKQARQYEKKQQFVEKKDHFKRLLGISLTSKNKQSKVRFRNMLQKSGYILPKHKRDINNNDKQQDRLSQIIDSQIHN